MRAARELVDGVRGEHTYGVNTGFGRFVSAHIPEELAEELQLRLLRSHACGVGEPYPDDVVRAAMLLRANALAKGFSGAHVTTVELLLECLNRGVLPWVPARGSVGASGDLAPLAHLALPLVGEGQAVVDGELLNGTAALRSVGLEPIRLASKEGLSLVNGTQFMAAMATLGRRTRAAVGSDRGPRMRALARVAAGLEDELSPGDTPCAAAEGPAGLGRERLAAPRRLRDHRVASLVRQGAGRVLASVRTAGARRVPRPARVRRGDRLRRAQRRDGQPTGARRRGGDRLGRQLPWAAARIRPRHARDGGRRAREHLRAPRRAAREPDASRTACRPSSSRREGSTPAS